MQEFFRNPREDYSRRLIAALPDLTHFHDRCEGEALLQLDDVKVHFPIRKGVLQRVVAYTRAVDGVSLRIGRGETYALVGESGSGKSTLGRAILNLERVAAGQITFQGEPIHALSRRAMLPYRKKIQVVFQNPYSSMNPRLTVGALAATLDHPPPRCCRASRCRRCGIGCTSCRCTGRARSAPTATPRRGGFLPPVPLPRRMWAGSQFEFRAPMRVGDARRAHAPPSTTCPSRRAARGELVFVKVRHELRCNGAAEPALVEFHDIVYRDAQRPDDVAPPPQARADGAAWQREIVPDDVLLFRYSALTFNGHRIHYDRPYVTEVEGYPGLIVHGPLIATLLMDLLRRQMPDADVATLPLQGRAPDLRPARPFRVSGAAAGRRQDRPALGPGPRRLADDGRHRHLR